MDSNVRSRSIFSFFVKNVQKQYFQRLKIQVMRSVRSLHTPDLKNGDNYQLRNPVTECLMAAFNLKYRRRNKEF